MSFESDLVTSMEAMTVNRRWKQSRGYNVRKNFTDQLVDYKKDAAKKAGPLEYIVDGDNDTAIDDWVGMRPSNCWVANGVSEVKVYRNGATKELAEKLYQDFEAAGRDEMMAEFKKMEKKHTMKSPTVTEASIKALAVKHKFTSGKWTVPIAWAEADAAWAKLVRGFVDGEFADDLGVVFVRIYGRETPEKNPHSSHKGERTENTMITIGTTDWTDRESTEKVAEIARRLTGLTVAFKYKADVYTRLEIFRNNVYNLRPTIYQLQ